MVRIILTQDTKLSPTGTLLPQDVAIAAMVIDALHLLCVLERDAAEKGGWMKEARSVYPSIDQLEYSNPFDIGAYLSDIAKKIAEPVLDRVFYFTPEYKRRTAEAEKVRQEAIALKIENVRRIQELSGRPPHYHWSEEERRRAERLVGEVIGQQGLKVTLSAPDDETKQSEPKIR